MSRNSFRATSCGSSSRSGGVSVRDDTVFVDKAVGPQACSVTKKVHGQTAPYDVMNSKTVTFKVNGSGPFTTLICTTFKKRAFNFGGTAGGP